MSYQLWLESSRPQHCQGSLKGRNSSRTQQSVAQTPFLPPKSLNPLGIPCNLQRLFTLECLLICSQVPKGGWGQASIRLLNTYIKKGYKIQCNVTHHPKESFLNLSPNNMDCTICCWWLDSIPAYATYEMSLAPSPPQVI